MVNVIRSSLYKLMKDATFRVTLFVGIGLAIVLTLIYYGVSIALVDANPGSPQHMMCNGTFMLISSSSPVQNYALAVPINLITLIVGEYSYGTIRNKIIAGYNKSVIYFSLIITGLIFTFSLMAVYLLLSVGFATILGGFNLVGEKGIITDISTGMIVRYIVIAFLSFGFVSIFSIFVATNIRHIGGSLGIVIGVLIFLLIISLIVSNIPNIDFNKFMPWVDPIFYPSLSSANSFYYLKNNTNFLGAFLCPIYFSALFLFLGNKLFKKRDIK